MNELFKSKFKVVCCVDNNQKGFQLNFQSDGSSNTCVKVTGTCVKDFVQVDEIMHRMKVYSDVTCINQAVPSPYDMPRF